MTHRPGEFDTVLFADYSGAASPAVQRRAIALWRADRGGRPRKVEGPFTRESLREKLLALLLQATRESRRVLFGIDHQWSWPRDLWAAAGLVGLPWRKALAALVEGSDGRPPLGPAHVFPAAFNAWAGKPIFHCRVRGLARAYAVPTLGTWAGDPVRLAERAMAGAKPATRLGGTGAVAGQTLVGLVELHRLLEGARHLGVPVLAWPMDALADDGRSHVGCEIYPSFCRPRHVPKTDDADARWTCRWASRADLARAFDLTGAPSAVREAARLEGWILGASPTSSGGSFLMADSRDEPGAADKAAELKVFISHRASVCGECHEELGHHAWVFLAGDRGALCLSCADLDHLVFLPSGDTAVTRRARKRSTLSAVVLKWSRARKRYERQGLLVEEDALHEAEASCLADEEARARRRERAAVRRAELDQEFVARFAERVRALFPGCPAGRENAIAEHACEKYSGRVGRSAAARRLDDEAVRLAVAAHVRHRETGYDEWLARGEERHDARARVRHQVETVLDRWGRPALDTRGPRS